jgi:glycosyltransferase involved in cell wall biosynthesis
VTNQTKKVRVAWLLPDIGTGGLSFQHLLSEFVKTFPTTMTFTGRWPGYAPGYDNAYAIEVVGSTRYIELTKTATGYSVGFSYVSPHIISKLLQFRPKVIFANAFSVWTALALLFKPIGRWKLIIIYEGCSPGVDYRNSPLRLRSRRWLVNGADAYVVNGRAAEEYFIQVLKASKERIFDRPFLVPSLKAVLQCPEQDRLQIRDQLQKPIFLFVGQLIPRKGLKILLEACVVLKTKGYHDYTLLVIGDGEERQELELFATQQGLAEQVKWLGKVEYRCMGVYFQQADVFVFPTYEDIWGMVLPEAMAFGKPAICSKGAGAAELVTDQIHAFLFDPGNVQELAGYMSQFIDHPELISTMGEQVRQMMMMHTPEKAVETFLDAAKLVLKC